MLLLNLAARRLGCLHQQRSRTTPLRHRMDRAAAAAPSRGVPAGSGAAAAAAAVAAAAAALPLWQRIEERYNTAQQDAAATMTDTNTGGAVV